MDSPVSGSKEEAGCTGTILHPSCMDGKKLPRKSDYLTRDRLKNTITKVVINIDYNIKNTIYHDGYTTLYL